MRIISQDGTLDMPYEQVIIQRFKDEIYFLNKNLTGVEHLVGDMVVAKYSTEEKAQKTEEGLAENETSDEEKENGTHSVKVIINGTPVTLTGRESYMFVDLFEFYEFDLSASAGRAIITKLNGQNAQYTAELKDGDVIELAWKEK